MNKYALRTGAKFASACVALIAGVVFTAQTFGANYQRFDDVIVRGTMSVGSNSTPNSKSILDLTSTTLGFLQPRLTTVQRDAISSPTTGLSVFNSTTGLPNYYNGSAWLQLASLSGTEVLTNKTLSGNTATNLISGSGTLTLNTSGTITVPNATDTLVGKATTDVLTNKTLSGNTATNLISGSGTFTFNTSGTITVPNGTDTLVGKATTDILTNKTLSGNTATNLVSGAGTLTLNTSGTITVPNGTDTLVGKATTDILTNKTLTSPTINSGTINTPTIDVITWDDQGSTPSTPSSGLYKMYFKTDGNLYSLNSGGVESAVGSSGAGGTNDQREFISNGTFETATTGWSTYADAAATSPVDGTGGSPNVTINRTTTAGEVIRGTASLELVKGAANRQGEGVSYDFTIDYQDYKNGQPIFITFDYNTTANYANGDIKVFVYDKDSSTLITVRDSSNLSGALQPSLNGTRFTGSFYPVSTTSDDYRIIFHITSTNASAYDFHLDSVHAGISPTIPGAIISEWTSFTPTGSFTNTTYTGFKRRVGDTVEVQIFGSLTGTPGAATLTFNYPETPDTSKMPDSGNLDATYLGKCYFIDTSASTAYDGAYVQASSTSNVRVTHGVASTTNATTTPVTNTTPFSFAVSDKIACSFRYPVSGWAATTTLNATEAFMSTIKYRGTFSQTVNNTTPSITLTDVTDAQNVVVSSTFTAPKTGAYKVQGSMRTGSVAWTAGNTIELYYSLNGGGNTVFGRNNMAAYTGIAQLLGTETLYLTKGDTLAFKAYADQSQTSTGTILIEEIPDFSIFSTYGPFELKTATSSQKTPSATNNYHSLTGNSIALTTGTWRLFGKAIFEPSGTPAYTGCFAGWYGGNGGDSGSAPTALSSVSGLTILSATGTGAQVLTGWNNSSASFTDCYINAQELIVTCTAAICTVYLNTYGSMATPSAARITAYANAARLQ